MENLKELLASIYGDIYKKNEAGGNNAIPTSAEFHDEIINTYNLIPFGIPKLIKILIDAHKIFSFPIVEADRKQKLRRIEAYVVCHGPIIKKLKKQYEDDLIKEYSHEFQKKLNPDIILKEFVPLLDKYNNSKLGKVTNIVLNLRHYDVLIEKSIMKYASSWQEKQLDNEIQRSDQLSAFINRPSDGKSDDYIRNPIKNIESDQAFDTKKIPSNYSIEKTIAIYGIEFYTRLCFRDYQYNLIQKLIEQGVIIEQEDLQTIKKMLQKERANADKDMKLQEHAQEINLLDKCLNEHLKKD